MLTPWRETAEAVYSSWDAYGAWLAAEIEKKTSDWKKQFTRSDTAMEWIDILRLGQNE